MEKIQGFRTLTTVERDERDCFVCSHGHPAQEDWGTPVVEDTHTGNALCMWCAVIPLTGDRKARALAAVLNAYDASPWGEQGVWEDVLTREGMDAEIDWDATDDAGTSTDSAGPIYLHDGSSVSYNHDRGAWVPA